MSRNIRSQNFDRGARAQNALEAELFEELARLYRDADDAFAGWSCDTSTECCRFGITGREPYVTSIEIAYLRRALAERGGKGAPAKSARALPLAREGAPRDERTCPMLVNEGGGRCAVYAARPLGCRTFYCDRAVPFAPVKHSEISSLVRRVKDIAARHAPEGDLGRPLTKAL